MAKGKPGPIRQFFRGVMTAIKLVYLTVVLCIFAVLCYVVYCFYPLYNPPKVEIPSGSSEEDYVLWQFQSYPKNPAVFQQVRVYRDGRSEIYITREQGDYDIVDGSLLKWNMKLDKKTRILHFRRSDLISELKAKKLYLDALKANCMNVRDVPVSRGENVLQMKIICGMGANKAKGPDFIGSAVAYPPEKWLNRMYWQQFIGIIMNDKSIQTYMLKREYIKPSAKKK